MSQFSDDFGSMIGRVQSFRPELSSAQVGSWINDRIRQALDVRTYWADLIKPGIVSLPDQYTTGTVSVTTASDIFTGVGTVWPVDDVVNTTITEAVNDIGYVEVTPGAMTGITEDSILYVDALGTPEAVPVVELKKSTIIAKFASIHSAAATATQSSLVNQQFRIAVSDPIFTVRNVISTTSLQATQPWGGADKSTQTYQVLRMYVTLASDLKGVVVMKDEQKGSPVRLHVSLAEINWRDPQRTAMNSSGVLSLVDLGPSDSGNMQFELWPSQTSARQFSFLYYRQWPELVSETDRPPWFINPSIFVDGAIADALRYRKGPKDIFHNPQMARDYETRFIGGLQNAKNADQSKWLRDYEYDYSRAYGAGGANFWQSHDPDLFHWNLGGGGY